MPCGEVPCRAAPRRPPRPPARVACARVCMHAHACVCMRTRVYACARVHACVFWQGVWRVCALRNPSGPPLPHPATPTPAHLPPIRVRQPELHQLRVLRLILLHVPVHLPQEREELLLHGQRQRVVLLRQDLQQRPQGQQLLRGQLRAAVEPHAARGHELHDGGEAALDLRRRDGVQIGAGRTKAGGEGGS